MKLTSANTAQKTSKNRRSSRKSVLVTKVSRYSTNSVLDHHVNIFYLFLQEYIIHKIFSIFFLVPSSIKGNPWINQYPHQ